MTVEATDYMTVETTHCMTVVVIALSPDLLRFSLFSLCWQ